MMKIEGFENTDEPFYTVNRVEFDGIKIAEIYWHAVEYSGLDFVLIFFAVLMQSPQCKIWQILKPTCSYVL